MRIFIFRMIGNTIVRIICYACGEKNSHWRIIVFIAFAVAAIFYLAEIYGVIPFENGSMGIPFSSSGLGHSLAIGNLFLYPSHMGYPVGAPFTFGLPFGVVQALMIRCLDIDSVDAYAVAGLLFLLLAFIGAFMLARQVGADMIVAVFCATIYLSSPFVTMHLGYGSLGFAFALFPTYFLVAWRSFDILGSHSTIWLKTACLLMLCFTATFALFMDGYSFTMLALMAGVLATYYLSINVTRRCWSDMATVIVAYIAAFSAAYAVYTAYLPQAKSYTLMSMEFFRAFGADISTVLIPTRGVHYLYDLLGWSELRNPRIYYGDDSVFWANFLGIALIVACWGVFTARLPKKLVCIILLATSVALILSLGPSFKFRSYRPKDDVETMFNYNMPESAARFSLGTAWIYKNIPGIKVMRATYRWGLVVRLMIALFCSGALTWLRKTYGVWAMLVVSLLLLIENIPPPSSFRVPDRHYYMIRQFDRDVIEPLRKYVAPGEKVYFWPSGNDFAVNYIAPRLGIYAYNVGGDKRQEIAFENWPLAMQDMHHGRCPGVNAARLMRNGELDVLVIPFFDLLWDAHSWPPKDDSVEQRRAMFNQLDLQKPYFQIFEDKYFVLLRQSLKTEELLKVSALPFGSSIPFFAESGALITNNCFLMMPTGWSLPDPSVTWTKGEWANLIFDRYAFPNTDLELLANVRGYTPKEHPEQIVDIFANEVSVDTWTFQHGDGLTQRRVFIPAEVIAKQQSLTLSFHITSPTSPFSLGLSEDRRQLGIGIQSLRFCSATSINVGQILGSSIPFNDILHNECSIQETTGWARPEPWGTWTTGEWATLSFDRYRFPEMDIELLADVRGLTAEHHPDQSVEILANGVPVGTWTFSHDEGVVQRRVLLPADVIAVQQPLTLAFHVKSPVSPFSLGLSEDRRQLGIGIQNIIFRLAELTDTVHAPK